MLQDDNEILEYIMLEIESIAKNIDDDTPEDHAAIERLEVLATEIFDHLGSKSIHTDYILRGNL